MTPRRVRARGGPARRTAGSRQPHLRVSRQRKWHVRRSYDPLRVMTVLTVSKMMYRSSAERQVLDVEEVVLQLLHRVLDAGAVGVAHLRPAGQAGLHDVALAVERDLPRQVLRRTRAAPAAGRPGSCRREHVPELRQFVEPRPAQEPPDRRHPRVVAGRRPHRAGRGLGVGRIDRNLWTREDAAVLADALAGDRAPGPATSA